jgi:SPP1 gp7 family putative phage head morphogenesis protein
MPTIYETARAFRRALLLKDAQTAGFLLAAYGAAYGRIAAALDELLRQMEEAKARGETVGASWLARRSRLESLQDQVSLEIVQFGNYADRTILNGQTEAVRAAEANALDLMRMGAQISDVVETGAAFNRVPFGALEQLVGFLADGSPLRELFAMNGPFAAHAAEEALVSGVAQGKNPRAIARELRDALEVPKVRALTIARTEVLRAYRGATGETIKANSDLVEGYIRVASLSIRTCPMCWALHGTFHEASEEFATHPNCRCTQVPAVMGARPKIKAGAMAFRDLSEEKQIEILGPKKHALYKAGKFDLPDLVEQTRSERWGAGLRERTLQELEGKRKAA